MIKAVHLYVINLFRSAVLSANSKYQDHPTGPVVVQRVGRVIYHFPQIVQHSSLHNELQGLQGSPQHRASLLCRFVQLFKSLALMAEKGICTLLYRLIEDMQEHAANVE